MTIYGIIGHVHVGQIALLNAVIGQSIISPSYNCLTCSIQITDSRDTYSVSIRRLSKRRSKPVIDKTYIFDNFTKLAECLNYISDHHGPRLLMIDITCPLLVSNSTWIVVPLYDSHDPKFMISRGIEKIIVMCSSASDYNLNFQNPHNVPVIQVTNITTGVMTIDLANAPKKSLFRILDTLNDE